MSSLFDERSSYSTQFNFNQVDYNAQRQLNATSNPALTRWVIQPKSTTDQRRFNELIGTNIFHPPEVIKQLSFGVGQGIGLSMPMPQAGTTATVLNLGNQKYAIGAIILAPNPKYVYSSTRAKTNLGTPLPSAFKPAITSAGGWVNVGPFCSIGDLTTLDTDLQSPLTPGSLSTIDPFTSIKSKVEPISSTTLVNSRNICSLTPMSSLTNEQAAADALKAASDTLKDTKENDLHLIDPVSKIQSRQDTPTLSRQQQFKLQVLQQIQQSAQNAIGVEAGRAASYPLLYTLANAAWSDPVLTEAFKQIAIIEANPTFAKILEIQRTVNKYLPIAKQVLGFLFPEKGAPALDTFGTTADLGTVTITPNYQSTVTRLNLFLPIDLQLRLDASGSTLILGTYTAKLNTPFPFTDDFKAYVDRVNAYLPSDLIWKWGLGEPPRLLILAKGIAINLSLGLLVSNTALDAATIVNQHLSCASVDMSLRVAIADGVTTASFSNADSAPNALQDELFSALPNLLSFTNDKIEINPDGLLNLQQSVLNTVLPSGLQIGLKAATDGSLEQINLGPLQATRTSATSWTFQVPNANNLASGLGVLQSIGVIPPDLNYLQTALVNFGSLYEHNKQLFVDVLGANNIVDSILNSPLAKFQLDYTSGIAITQLPDTTIPGYGPEFPESPEAWNELSDVSLTIASSGYSDPTALENFTARPTLQGTFLPLLTFAESQLSTSRSNNNVNDTYSQLGRSDSGVSISSGLVASPTGVNYSLLPSLCADTGALLPPTTGEPYGIILPASNTPLISGFEYTAENPATPLQLIVVDTIDPQSNRDALEVQLIETGLGELASRVLDTLDVMLYPPTTYFETFEVDKDEPDNLIPGVDYVSAVETTEWRLPNPLDLTERNLQPIASNLNPSVIDLIEVIQSIGNLPTQQIIGGLLVTVSPSTVLREVSKISQGRIRELLDCQSLNPYQAALGSLKTSSDFPTYAQSYGILDAQPANVYMQAPNQLLDLIKQTEHRLVPVVEQLLAGNLPGFFQQLIWAKTGADIYNSPLAYLALQTNVRSYYGQAVPSSNPSDEWLKELLN